MQLKEILQIGKEQLKGFSETVSLDVEILVSHVLGLNRVDLILKDDLDITEKQEKEILELIERRKQNEPIAYIINQKEFFGLEFYVDENVLIPRPETEVLVESVIKLVKSFNKVQVGDLNQHLCVTQSLSKSAPFGILRQAQDDILIVDVGTGSGCIPISLAMNLENVDLMAIDISEGALSVAKRNVERFGLSSRIQLICGDLLKSPLRGLGGVESVEEKNSQKDISQETNNQILRFKFPHTGQVPILNQQKEILRQAQDDLIITANLPYVEEGAELENNVKNYEPHLALFSGEDGLDHYRRLLKEAAEINPLAIFLEIDPKQVDSLKEISAELFPEYKINVVKDLAGKDRVFILSN